MDTQNHPLLDENGDGNYNNDGDGIWDTGVIILGLKYDMDGTDIPARQDKKDGLVQDHQAFIQYTKQLIERASDDDCEICNRVYNGNVMSSSVSTEIHSLWLQEAREKRPQYPFNISCNRRYSGYEISSRIHCSRPSCTKCYHCHRTNTCCPRCLERHIFRISNKNASRSSNISSNYNVDFTP